MILMLALVAPSAFAQTVPRVVPLSTHVGAAPTSPMQAAVELGQRQAQEMKSRGLLQQLRLQNAQTSQQLYRLQQQQNMQALQQQAQRLAQQRLDRQLQQQLQRQLQQAAQQTASCPLNGAGQPACR
ncbi:MAG TPA: hypothetical protein VFW60_05265 [Rhodanobacteraceae bacterium]|nr:hypothetical protein [Rhodanobacteraceae bacterium]